MLETAKERVKLIKAGISVKDIEKLYIIYNEFIIVDSHILYEYNNHKHRKKCHRDQIKK